MIQNTRGINAAVDDLMAKHGSKFKQGFDVWLKDNWQIYIRFEEEARKIAFSGRKHYSARTIVEFIRHQTALFEKSGHFEFIEEIAL